MWSVCGGWGVDITLSHFGAVQVCSRGGANVVEGRGVREIAGIYCDAPV
jgi:hypothetical protein